MKKNILFVTALLLVAGILALALSIGRDAGGQAIVTVAGAQGESQSISLEKQGIYTVDAAAGARMPVTLEVKDGQIRFIDSQCPDHLCEGFGWLRYAHDEAICLPAGVVVSVEKSAG